MYRIKRLDAFALVVKALERGDEKTANKMMQIIVKEIQKNKTSKNQSLVIEIENAKDAHLFKELLIDETDE